MDPRAPVVVGVGQTSQRVTPDVAKPPIELLEEAARLAAADSGAALLDAIDIIGVVHIASWPYPDPGALLARRLGTTPRATAVSTVGGNSPQLLVNEFADRIQRGECDVVLIGGAESMYARWRARRQPRVDLTWDNGGDAPCAWVIGDDRAGTNDEEMRHGALAPTFVYPLFETALRSAAGRTIEHHQQYVADLWASFAAVAADNPNAWSRTAFTADDIRTVAPDNRMVVFPYTKRMCANIDVDQGAAIFLCSYDAARRAGVAEDRMVYVHAGADAHDHWFVTERDSLARSPALAATVSDTLEAARIGVDDVAHYDLYSCFPSAVQVAMREIGLTGASRPLTVTGGLGFAGGPVNNYPTHAIARMVETLRSNPGAYGLTTALGWYLTKHAAAVWSTRPPDGGFRRVPHETTQARVDQLPRRASAGLVDEDVEIEATSVAFERDGTPASGLVTARVDSRRAIAVCRDPELLHAFTTEPWEGRRVRVTNEGNVNEVVAAIG